MLVEPLSVHSPPARLILSRTFQSKKSEIRTRRALDFETREFAELISHFELVTVCPRMFLIKLLGRSLPMSLPLSSVLLYGCCLPDRR